MRDAHRFFRRFCAEQQFVGYCPGKGTVRLRKSAHRLRMPVLCLILDVVRLD